MSRVSPAIASSSSAAASLTYASRLPSDASDNSPPDAVSRGPNPCSRPCSSPTTFRKPSLSFVLGLTDGATNASCGVRPSIVSRWATSCCSFSKRSYSMNGVEPKESPASAKDGTITSSIVFSESSVSCRIETLSVSPVPSAAEMITVLSITPITISAVWPHRRVIGLTPILNMTRLRSASSATMAIASRNTTSRVAIITFMETPKISCIRRPAQAFRRPVKRRPALSGRPASGLSGGHAGRPPRSGSPRRRSGC